MAPKIYHLHPLVAGDLSDWPAHFARCRAMGFDTVCVAPPFVPGASGDIFVTADHEALHPALGWPGSADAGIARITREAAEHGLRVWLDLAIDQVAIDAADSPPRGAVVRPGGCGAPPSPWRTPRRLDVAYARLEQTEVAEAMAEWWLDRLARLVRAGIAGFRCLDPDHAPASLWRRIIGAFEAGAMPLPGVDAGCRTLRVAATGRGRLRPRVFLARMVGWARELAGGGGRDVAAHRAGDRLARAFVLRTARGAAGAWQRYCAPTIASRCGWPLPPGAACSCRWASSMPLAVRSTPRWAGPEDFRRARDEAPCDLTADVAAANALVDRIAEYRVDGEMRQLTDAQDAVTALLRSDAPDARNASRAVMVLANPDIGRIVPVGLSVSPLPPQAGAALALEEPREDADAPMAPGEVRVLAYAPTRPVIHPRGPRRGASSVAARRRADRHRGDSSAGARWCVCGEAAGR